MVKVFDVVIARTGLLDHQALEAGFDALTTDIEAWDHKPYYPGATRLRIRITCDPGTGRLLGAQLTGRYGAEISKRIDVFATALHQEATVETLANLDLSYTPPLSSPWDPIQLAALSWIKGAGN